MARKNHLVVKRGGGVITVAHGAADGSGGDGARRRRDAVAAVEQCVSPHDAHGGCAIAFFLVARHARFAQQARDGMVPPSDNARMGAKRRVRGVKNMKSRHHLVILDVSDALFLRELKRIIEQVIAKIEVKQKKEITAPPPHKRVTLIYDRQTASHAARTPPADEWRALGITHLIMLSGEAVESPNSVESPRGMTVHLMKKPIKIQALLDLLEDTTV